MPTPIAAQLGLSAAQGALQTGFNAVSNIMNVANYNRQRRDQQADWLRDTYYNSPAEQVKRMQAAGISPHSAFGNPSVNMAAPQQRPAMGQSPAAYQVNGAINAVQMQQGIAQLKQMELQNAKIQAETEQIQSNTKSVNLNFEVDNNTLLPRRMGEIELQLRNIQKADIDINIKRQQVDQIKAQIQNIISQTGLNNIEKTYRAPLLQGKVDLQKAQTAATTAQIAKTYADIDRIRIHNDQDIKMFQYRVNQITQDIQRLRLANEGKVYENIYAPDHYKYRNEIQNTDLNTKRNQLKYLETIPPEARFMLERMGGEDLVKMLSTRRFGGKTTKGWRERNGKWEEWESTTR